jgi:hypothetical protein
MARWLQSIQPQSCYYSVWQLASQMTSAYQAGLPSFARAASEMGAYMAGNGGVAALESAQQHVDSAKPFMDQGNSLSMQLTAAIRTMPCA